MTGLSSRSLCCIRLPNTYKEHFLYAFLADNQPYSKLLHNPYNTLYFVKHLTLFTLLLTSRQLSYVACQSIDD